MNRFIDNKRPIEQIFVAKPGATVAQNGGDPFNDATGKVDFVEGQIKIYDSKGLGVNDSNTAIAAADTITDSPEIFIVVGNESASNPLVKKPYPLSSRPYEVSESIIGSNRILYSYSDAKLPTWDKTFVSNINVEDETEYGVKIAVFGRDQDEAVGAQCGKPDALNVTYTTPDYTSLTWNDAQAKDDIIQNLVAGINRNSTALFYSKGYKPSKPLIAFAVDTNGAQGIDPTEAVPGSFLPVINSKIGVKGITLSLELINSFIESDLPAGSKIIPVDVAQAGGLAAAGSAINGPDGNPSGFVTGKANAFIVMALDRELVYEDRIAYVKNRASVGLFSGFNTQTVNIEKIQYADEGKGLKRQLDKFWKDTAGQRIYDQYRGFETMRIDIPSPVTEDYYDVLLLEHYRRDQIDGATTLTKPFRVYIYVPVSVAYVARVSDTPPAITMTADAGASTLISTYLKPWVESTLSPIIKD